jgi:hypothetical protein
LMWDEPGSRPTHFYERKLQHAQEFRVKIWGKP